MQWSFAPPCYSATKTTTSDPDEGVFDLEQVKATPGQVVHAFRKNFGLTLVELYQITGITHRNLSAIERDKMGLGVRRAVLLAAAFGIEPQQILFPHGYVRPDCRDVGFVRTRAKRLIEKKRRAT
jgi:transcriptional regulator with XRE-family HTH domain